MLVRTRCEKYLHAQHLLMALNGVSDDVGVSAPAGRRIDIVERRREVEGLRHKRLSIAWRGLPRITRLNYFPYARTAAACTSFNGTFLDLAIRAQSSNSGATFTTCPFRRETLMETSPNSVFTTTDSRSRTERVAV